MCVRACVYVCACVRACETCRVRKDSSGSRAKEQRENASFTPPEFRSRLVRVRDSDEIMPSETFDILFINHQL